VLAFPGRMGVWSSFDRLKNGTICRKKSQDLRKSLFRISLSGEWHRMQ